MRVVLHLNVALVLLLVSVRVVTQPEPWIQVVAAVVECSPAECRGCHLEYKRCCTLTYIHIPQGERVACVAI